MNRAKLKSLRNATLYLFILTVSLVATQEIIRHIPKEEPNKPSISQETAEVFLTLPQENAEGVFAHFQAPLKGKITSFYGYRTDPFTGAASYHNGVDIATETGTRVLAAEEGTVKASDYDAVGGHYVILSHENGSESYYGHLQTRIVARGDIVAQGDVIGLSGQTGAVTGPHLHFQLTYRGRTVDPARHIELCP